MAFHRNNNGSNNRYNNNRPNNFRPRHNNQQGGQNRRPVNRINHVFESNGPDGRVRGTAQQLVEKYVGMARDAHAGGDPVLMLNYYQHAEHYQRLYAEIMEENGMAEREREAQRAQYNQQPNVDGDANFAPDTMNQQQDGSEYNQERAPRQNQQRDDRYNEPRQQRDNREPQQGDQHRQPEQRAPRQQQQFDQKFDQTDGMDDSSQPEAGSMSTGGRVLGRRPAQNQPRSEAGPRQPQANQLQDDHMPSFLKQDIPIKAATPKAPRAAPVAPVAEAAADEPAAAAFGKRRAPTTRRTAADKAADAAGESSDTAE